MKVEIRGKQVMIQTELNAEDYAKYAGYGVYTVKDEDNNEVFRVAKSNYSTVTEYGINCDSTFRGKLVATTILSDDVEVQKFIDDMKPAFLALKENEPIILEQIAQLQARLEGLDDMIEVEE